MDRRFLRIIFIFEFLIALIAVFTAWSQIGGQTHLDLMAWYFKLLLGPAMAYVVVRATMSAVMHDRPWNSRTLRWTGILLLLAAAAGMITYYTHLYEPNEDEDESPTTQTTINPL